MNEKQRLQLHNMISANNVEDQTNLIRNLKHSVILKSEINNLILIKSKYGNDQNKIMDECMENCGFLYTYYTDLFNKIKKDEIDLKILNQFLDVLKKIEDGELDQHEGSFMVGTILKELYIDSALKKAEKLNENNDMSNEEQKPQAKKPQIKISWNEYKKMKI
jgi:hypothetical protein